MNVSNGANTPVEIKSLTFLTTVNQLKFIFSHRIVVQTQSCHLSYGNMSDWSFEAGKSYFRELSFIQVALY